MHDVRGFDGLSNMTSLVEGVRQAMMAGAVAAALVATMMPRRGRSEVAKEWTAP